MKKMKNGHYFVDMNHTEKFQITDLLKIWVSSFLSVDGNGISASPIMKKLKNGHHFININCMENFQITDPPPKVWVSGFLSVDRNRISASAIMKKLKNGHHFVNIVWVPVLPHQSPMCSFTLPDICNIYRTMQDRGTCSKL